MRLALLAVLAALLPAAALADHSLNAHPVDANVDGDPAIERLSADRARHRGIGYRRAVLHEDCDGIDPAWRLTGRHDIVPILEVRELNGRLARPEIYVEGRSGVSNGIGDAAIYSHRGCAGPRALFAYSSRAPRPAPPRGTWVTNFGLQIKNYERRTPARELRLLENLAVDGQPAVTANGSRTTYWRYRKGRYVRYRTRVTMPRRVG